MDVRGLFLFFLDLSFSCALFFFFLSFFFERLFRCAFIVFSLYSFTFSPLLLFFPHRLPHSQQKAKTTHLCLYKKQGLPKKRNPPRPPLLPPRHTSHPRQHPHHDALNNSVHGELSRRTRTCPGPFSVPSVSSSNYKA